MKLADFFPLCPLPTCAACNAHGAKQRHVPDIMRDIAQSSETYHYIQGGVRSGKTTGTAALFTLYALMIPSTQGIIFRKDFGLNFKTSWKAFQACLDNLQQQKLIPAPKWEVKKFGEYTKCTLHNGTVVYAGQSKNYSEFMGPEYGLIWIDDAMESSVEVFKGHGTVGGLQSRLTCPKAAYFNLRGSTVDLRRFFITTNPPPGVSEWWDIFGMKPGRRCFTDSSIPYRHTQMTTADNPFLPADYIETMKTNRGADEIARILYGQSVIDYGGKAVYHGYFYPQYHVGEFVYSVDLPLLVSWDFGYEHPAITFSQIRQCPFQENHLITLREVSNLYNLTIWDLYDHYLETIKLLYPYHDNDLIFHSCDVSGFKQSDSNPDKRGQAKILEEEKGLTFKRKKFLLDYSLDYMRNTFKHRCKCTFSPFLIDRSCRLLIEAYAGGYCFPRKRDGSYGDKPRNDHRYEDVSDSHRYCAENFLRLGLPWRQRITTELHRSPSPYAWIAGYEENTPFIVAS